MLADLPGVIPQQRVALCDVCVAPFEVRVDRHFRVDDDAGVIGKENANVGNDPAAVIVGRAILLDEVAVRQHAGALEHVAQLDLTPAAALVRRLQGIHERLGLLAKQLLRVGDGAELSAQRRMIPACLVQPAFELVERLPDGLDHRRDLLLPGIEVALRSVLRFFEGGLREGQERLVVLLERIRGERRERLAQRGFRALHDGELLGRAGALGGERRFGARQLLAQRPGRRRRARGAPRMRQEPAHRERGRGCDSETDGEHDGRSLGERRRECQTNRGSSPGVVDGS